MNQYLNLLLLCLLLNITNVGFADQKFDLAVCAIFQDDAKYLPEWIDFHDDQGVQHFYLYNNLSSDDFETILNPYIKRGLVTLIDWPYPQKDLVDWNGIQCNAYMDCIQRISDNVTWCAFIDTDEFLFCPNGSKLPIFLKNFIKFGAVGANWMLYGTSNVLIIPNGKKMIDFLVLRAKDSHKRHFHVKSIVQPKLVKRCFNPHFFWFDDKAFTVTENKIRFDGPFSPTISMNHIRINHYWSRDKQFFDEVKCARQTKWGFSCDKVISEEKELNDIYDPLSNYIKFKK